MRSLSIAMKEKAAAMKRPGVGGAAAFVTEGATLAAFSHTDDLEAKRAAAPTTLAVIEAAVKSTHWQYDREQQGKWLSDASEGIGKDVQPQRERERERSATQDVHEGELGRDARGAAETHH